MQKLNLRVSRTPIRNADWERIIDLNKKLSEMEKNLLLKVIAWDFYAKAGGSKEFNEFYKVSLQDKDLWHKIKKELINMNFWEASNLPNPKL